MQEKHGDTGEIYSGFYGLYDGGLYDSEGYTTESVSQTGDF